MTDPTHPNAELIRRFRILAEWLEAHPEIPTQHEGAMSICCLSREDFIATARAIPGMKHKDFSTDDIVRVHGEVAEGVAAYAFISRGLICHAVKETKTLPAEPEQVIPAKPERTVEVTRWECPDSILRDESPVTDDLDGLDAKLTASLPAMIEDAKEAP